jgi:hypothetical protein
VLVSVRRAIIAKLCRAAGGELEQIQLLPGHSPVQTPERYLGTKQDLVHSPSGLPSVKTRSPSFGKDTEEVNDERIAARTTDNGGQSSRLKAGFQ